MRNSTVTGFQQLALNIKELEKKIQRGAMRSALTKAARPVVAAAKRLAPVRTGTLKKSLRAKIATYPKSGVVMAFIGPARSAVAQADFGDGKGIVNLRPSKYAHLVEFGTASRGVWKQKKVTITPGAAPQPFLRPAWESTRGPVIEKYRTDLIPAIQQAAAAIYRQSRRTLRNAR